MPLTDFIRVSFEVELNAVVSASFGIPLILGQHTRFPERFRIYTGLQGMLDDGFITSDPEYAKAQILLSQARRPALFVVGRRLAPVARVVTITVDTAVDNTVYTFEVDGITVASANSGVGATVGSIRTLLVTAANLALADQTAAPTGGASLTLTADVAGRSFAITETDPNLSFVESVANVGAAEDLTAIADAGALWYGTLLTSRAAGDILEAAAWTEASEIPRTLIPQSNEAASLNTPYASNGTNLSARLRALGYTRTMLLMHHSNGEHFDGMLAGLMFPTRPGTETWALKRGAGITPSPFTATQRNNVRGANANYYYEPAPGVSVSWEGVTSAGQWFDQVRLGDAISAGCSQRLLDLQITALKVPMTDAGIQLITDQVTAELESWEQLGALNPNPKYVVTRPLLSDISPGNRAARILDPPITAQAYSSGAIHQIQVGGSLSP